MPQPLPDDFEPTRAESSAILRATSDLVLVIDGDGRYVRVGPTAHDTLYRPAPDLVGRTFAEVFPADIASRFRAVVRRAIDDGDDQEVDYPLDIHGATRWFHATVAPTGEGTVVWLARDVTEARATEARRRASETIFRLLAEHSTELVGLHAPDGRYEYVSPSAARLLDRAPEALLGTDAFALVHPEDVTRVRRESFDVALVGIQPPPTVYRMRTAHDDYVWFEMIVQPIRDASGGVAWLLSSSRDVTERRESEQALVDAALRDDLTGVFNRRGFLVEAERTVARAQRSGTGVILVSIDVDDLKPINDRFGHDAGDAALRAATDLLRATVRDGDVLGRLGGDEFAMLLAPSSHAPRGAALDAFAFEQRIRDRVAQQIATHAAEARLAGRPWTLAVSAGIVVLPEVPPTATPATTLGDLLREADRRLYDDKRARKIGAADAAG